MIEPGDIIGVTVVKREADQCEADQQAVQQYQRREGYTETVETVQKDGKMIAVIQSTLLL